MITIQCTICSSEYDVKPYRAKTSKYCSSECYGVSCKGKVPKSAFKKGHHASPETEFKKGHTPYSKRHPGCMQRGEQHYAWKGDEVGYFALHNWINRTLGKPNVCQHCPKVFPKNSRSLNWANISGDYKRDLTDWVRLCASCHKKYDLSRKKKSINY